LALVSCLGVAPVAANQACSAPLADWQPRQALQAKLEAEGWTVLSIRSDDGCYKVRATRPGGARLDAKYDPASLERVQSKQDEDDD
jgi:hypothetical protein